MKYSLLLLTFIIFSCNNKKEAEYPEVDKIATDTVTNHAISSKLIVVPGNRIGNIHLEQNASEIEAILGKADLSDSAMGKSWLTWFSKIADSVTGNELNIYTTYKDNELREKVVRQIRITSDEFKTEKGLSTGNTLRGIKAAYPNLELVGKYDQETAFPVSVYDVLSEGIAFEIEHDTCVGIIIHHKNHKVTDEYITFHPDMKPM